MDIISSSSSPLKTPSPAKIRAGRYVSIFLSVVFFMTAFGMGFWTGKYQDAKQQQLTAGDDSTTINKVVNLNRLLNHSNTVDFNQFWDVWDRVKDRYVVTSTVKDVDLFYGAIQGMVYALNDPYSVYFPPKEAEQFNKDLSGELEGIGAEVGEKNNQLTVIAPLPDSPAEKAGIKSRDKIMAIDGEVTGGMDVTTAVTKIRGPAGTKVVLKIERDNDPQNIEITIVRSKINVPSVIFSIKDEKYAYVRIMQFDQDAGAKFAEVANKIKQQKIKGMVLDLRNNPGGYLEAAVEIASEWIPGGGAIVSEKGVSTPENIHKSTGADHLSGVQTVILVNGGSASASEILAGALRDYKKATLIGDQTYGKGSVQDYENFSDGSALKLTVAEWFTPNGININHEGIAPDILIPEEDMASSTEDIALQKGLEVLGDTSAK